MDVKLPTTGCNIINSSTSFYNYSPDNKTRELYYIYDGKALLANSIYNQYGYSYSGDCLSTGDIVYKPEYKEVLFPFLAVFVSLFIFWSAYKLMLSMWWRKR